MVRIGVFVADPLSASSFRFPAFSSTGGNPNTRKQTKFETCDEGLSALALKSGLYVD